jgi:alkanesulfonate monooxygenase SsuD/methylene tetrahydromethanopterin reductase-like flavin-dependent oxidoreductase (luciferase family)
MKLPVMKIGVFDHMDRGLAPLHQFYEERLKLIEAYDRAGFYGYHVAEHHATPLGVAPSPGVWLAAIAQRTRNLRFGPLVYLLPLYHPIKLLEEICMLDHMSGGRLLLGVGRGISPIDRVSLYPPLQPFDNARSFLWAGLRRSHVIWNLRLVP